MRAVDDVNGRSNLHLATMSGHYDIVVMLAETGKVDTSLEDMHGRRALHYAAMGGHDRIVKFLLEKKVADLTIDQDGSSPLVYAVTRGHTTCVAAFLEKGGDILHRMDSNSCSGEVTFKYSGLKKSILFMQRKPGKIPLLWRQNLATRKSLKCSSKRDLMSTNSPSPGSAPSI